MIPLQRLEALVALARYGTVSAAASHLGYGQPTISHHLSRLEAETHAVLLHRVGRGVRLTPDGQRLAERGEEILTLLRRAEQELQAATALRGGTVRLAVFPSAAATLVPRVVHWLGTAHPQLQVLLQDAEPPDALALLRAGEVELALTFDYSGQQEGPEFTSRHLFEDPLFLLTPGARLPPRPAGDPLAAHRGDRWVTGCQRCRSELEGLCARAGFAPQIVYASDDYVAVQALVASGVGVSTLPGLALTAYRNPAVTVEPIPGASRRVQVVTLGKPPNPRSVDAVIDGLVAGVAQLGGPPAVRDR